MILLRPFLLLAAWLSRLLRRRRARKLRALGLPTAQQAVAGLLIGPRPALPLALREPGPLLPPEGSADFWALPTLACAVRRPGAPPGRLLRLSALPPPLRPLALLRLECFGLDAEARPAADRLAPSRALARPLRSPALETLEALARHALPLAGPGTTARVRPAAFGLDGGFAPAAARLAAALVRRDPGSVHPPAPLRLPVFHDLGVARPERLGVDERGRLASEREVPELSAERPPPPRPGRWLRARTPVARAPIFRLAPRHFRLDPRSAQPANELIIPPREPLREIWINRDFERDKLELPWMSRTFLMGLSSGPIELFTWWWLQGHRHEAGAGEPLPLEQPKLIGQLVFHLCKEQMLIRRDVTRDQTGPELGGFQLEKDEPQIQRHTVIKNLGEMVPPKEWIPVASVATEPVFPPSRPAFDAYVQWRTLLDGLEER